MTTSENKSRPIIFRDLLHWFRPGIPTQAGIWLVRHAVTSGSTWDEVLFFDGKSWWNELSFETVSPPLSGSLFAGPFALQREIVLTPKGIEQVFERGRQSVFDELHGMDKGLTLYEVLIDSGTLKPPASLVNGCCDCADELPSQDLEGATCQAIHEATTAEAVMEPNFHRGIEPPPVGRHDAPLEPLVAALECECSKAGVKTERSRSDASILLRYGTNAMQVWPMPDGFSFKYIVRDREKLCNVPAAISIVKGIGTP